MDKTSVFELTYFYQTKRGKYGVVRADNIAEAAERINDSYSGLEDECDGLVCLSRVDNDYGVVEFNRLMERKH